MKVKIVKRKRNFLKKFPRNGSPSISRSSSSSPISKRIDYIKWKELFMLSLSKMLSINYWKECLRYLPILYNREVMQHLADEIFSISKRGCFDSRIGLIKPWITGSINGKTMHVPESGQLLIISRSGASIISSFY